MSIQHPTPRQVASLLGLPFGEPLGLRDTSADPGLFGPRSVTWRVMQEPMMVLGGARALLMQVAHPLVAEGALDHSVFEADPFGRLLRTSRWAVTVAFGTTAEADAACRRINAVHRRVQGTLDDTAATDRVAAGTAYDARDPELARWVHATLVDTLLVTHEALVGPLSRADQDRFVREWNAVAGRVGVPRAGHFQTRAELTTYIAEQITGGPVKPGEGSRRVAATVLSSPLAATRPAWPALTFISVGLLPPELREGYGLGWTRAHDVALRGVLRSARTARRATPAGLRCSANARFARERVAVEGPGRGVA